MNSTSIMKEFPKKEVLIYKNDKWVINPKYLINTISLEKIKRIIINYFDVQEERFSSKERKRELIIARSMYMIFARENTTYSYARIGSLADRDHANVMHNIATLRSDFETDKALYSHYQKIDKEYFA